jgi:NAD(P)-dependent dehydrogenase (short-subunit alcohol dehydrogenase family)
MKLGEDISAIVAGGATGLGAATAEKLAEAGCRVAILDMYRDEGEELVNKIGAIYCHMEIANDAAVDAALDMARGENGPERILVNCAGLSLDQPAIWRDRDSGSILTHDIPSFERVLQVNLTATFYIAIKCAASMMTLVPLDQGVRGVIINSASLAAEDAPERQVAYAAAEGGILAMTRPLARDLKKEGVRVSTIMAGRYDAALFAAPSEDAMEKIGATKRNPSGFNDPDEFAETALQVIGDDSVNGQWVRMKSAAQAHAA